MDPWDEQDLRDRSPDSTVGRLGTFADGEDRDVTILGWMSVVLVVVSVVAALSGIRWLVDEPDGGLMTGLTLFVVAVLALVASAVCALCSVIRAAELRIRRDR